MVYGVRAARPSTKWRSEAACENGAVSTTILRFNRTMNAPEIDPWTVMGLDNPGHINEHTPPEHDGAPTPLYEAGHTLLACDQNLVRSRSAIKGRYAYGSAVLDVALHVDGRQRYDRRRRAR